MTAGAVLILINLVIAIAGLIFIPYRDQMSQWISKRSIQGPIDMSRYLPRGKKIQRTATALFGGVLIAASLLGTNAAIGKILFGAEQTIVFSALIVAFLACSLAAFVVIGVGMFEHYQRLTLTPPYSLTFNKTAQASDGIA